MASSTRRSWQAASREIGGESACAKSVAARAFGEKVAITSLFRNSISDDDHDNPGVDHRIGNDHNGTSESVSRRGFESAVDNNGVKVSA